MKLVKVGAAALNQIPLDWYHNAANILRAVDHAREQQVQVLCLPELCITGYGCEDAFHAPGTSEMAMRVLHELAPQLHGIIVSLGLPVSYRGGLFNCAAMVVDGKAIGVVSKQNLPGDGLHYEPRWFKPWPNDAKGELDVDGREVPMGDLLFDCGGIRIGYEICEDAWVLDRPGGELAQQGMDILLNPSASHFAFEKNAVRQRLVVEGSRAFHAIYVYANMLGNEAGRALYDGDSMIAAGGKLLARGPRLTFRDFELTTAVVDVEATRMQRLRSASFPVHVESDLSTVVSEDFEFADVEHQSTSPEIPEWESSGSLKEEEFTRAVALGLFDYLRKSKSGGFTVSISGGADSAAVACLAALAIRWAISARGMDGFAECLKHIPSLAACESSDEAVGRMLTCVYQSTRNSSDTTQSAARQITEAVKAEYLLLDVDSIVQGYQDIVGEATQCEWNWEQHDLALQNIQARARGPSVWMVANLRRSILLATSNRSEAAVGYATMDGDTCGGLSPIAGIDKAFLRQWLRWMETKDRRDWALYPNCLP